MYTYKYCERYSGNSIFFSEWTDEETKLLLNFYETYCSKVGPMKKFKTKKAMWGQIAIDLNKIMKVTRTGLQVENRFKTVLKRKKQAVDNNKTTGSSRINIPYEEELAKISAIDDSIEPEVLRSSACGLKLLKVTDTHGDVLDSPSTSCSGSAEQKRKKYFKCSGQSKTIQETLMNIHHEKEEARERRHHEKMELLKELLKNKY